jgi:TolB-like protein/Flp pilus assembly protein TadD
MSPVDQKKNTKSSWRWLSRELKRREVYPVIVAYAIVGWILLQIGEVTFGPLGLPEWVMTALIIVVIAGFPVALVLAWMYDITPLGIRRDRIPSPARQADDYEPSIAVLPFLDLSPQRDQEYFCEGVAEEILNALTRIRNLHVAARSSSFQFSPQAGDVRAIGRKLGVKTILEGSVRKSGRRLRVTAQLVSVADGYHIWSKVFDEDLADVFAIQDEIAASIAESLVATISAQEKEAIRAVPRTHVDAYDYYLRGRRFFKRFHKVDIEHARQMFWQALDIDPNFALAWAGYADCHSFLMMYVDPDPIHAQQADQASRRALELGPQLAEAHASRGLACLVGRRFDKAEAAFRKALELNPRLFEAYYYYARTRFHQGDLEMAAELFRKAADADPADYQSRCLRVQILRGTGHEALAIEEAREAVGVLEKHLEWHPDDARSLHLGAGSLIVLGQIERAKNWLRRALQLDPDDPIVLYNVACNFATLGESEESLDYLEQAVEHGTVSSDWMRNDEDLVPLRDNPRYGALLQRVEEKESATVNPNH